MLEYDVGFDDKGKVAALKIRGYFLCGAEMNLGFNDMAVLTMAADQVHRALALCPRTKETECQGLLFLNPDVCLQWQ